MSEAHVNFLNNEKKITSRHNKIKELEKQYLEVHNKLQKERVSNKNALPSEGNASHYKKSL